MKKHDEGYVLPFVLVVTVVLCIVAVSILSSALHNLTAQQESIAQMQDKYAAQGEIEKVVAQLQLGVLADNLTGIADSTRVTRDGTVYTITATHNSVKIVCTYKDGKYTSYTVTIAEPEETTPATGGAAG